MPSRVTHVSQWRKVCICALALSGVALFSASTAAQALSNGGFESGWSDWLRQGEGISLSAEARSGQQSAKLTDKGSFISRVVAVSPGSQYRFSAWLRGGGTLGVKVKGQLYFQQPERLGDDWQSLDVLFDAGEADQVILFLAHGQGVARFDDLTFSPTSAPTTALSTTLLTTGAGGTGLSPDLPPGRNFDLLGWYLSTPRDEDGDGLGENTSERALASGFTDEQYFFTAPDGGMTFRATVAGGRTSMNTKFTRSELRQMLRRGDTRIKTKSDGVPNKNNWVLSSAPARAQRQAGAVDGRMEATLAVNHVTVTGAPNQVGRVIIGQIHAHKDEPIRLYYRKLPGNDRGAVYMAHEPSRGYGEEIWVELIGSRSDRAPDPDNGIALNETFSYRIDARGHRLSVEIYVQDQLRGSTQVDMQASGYDVAEDYMYFKAGVYNQNNTGDPDDYAQATFYRLITTH